MLRADGATSVRIRGDAARLAAMNKASAQGELLVHPIGVAHTPFAERASAPRQPYAAEGASGTIELFPNRNFEDALADLDAWDHIWVVFWFHLNESWRPK